MCKDLAQDDWQQGGIQIQSHATLTQNTPQEQNRTNMSVHKHIDDSPALLAKAKGEADRRNCQPLRQTQRTMPKRTGMMQPLCTYNVFA